MKLLFSRLARPATAVGRAYSSFFSSKPGGGRHFISAKPPKPVLQPGRAKVDNTTATGSPTESTTTTPSTNASSTVKVAASDEKSSSKPAETHPQSPTVSPSSMYSSNRVPVHPTLSSKEYKLHQFFSLHRPLLLLNQPTSTIFEADPSTPLFTSSKDQINDGSQHAFATIDNPPESSPDADADAARQLAHSLVMNQGWRRSCLGAGLVSAWTECPVLGE
ncbi:hypothetical protein JVU11DRAFT_652 [Chiua virens]|nr:hypothetical protein JVU11DRAFT_652 [Chiua virens]